MALGLYRSEKPVSEVNKKISEYVNKCVSAVYTAVVTVGQSVPDK